MHPHQILVGAFLLPWGIAIVALAWYSSTPEQARRIAQKRWWIDRGTARRRGMTKDEWIDYWARHQRPLVKWVFVPFAILWAGVCLFTIAPGLGA